MTEDRIKLYGFNNLTKSLCFNLYDICYAQSLVERKEYIKYIDDEYSADRLTAILSDVADIIGATILNVAKQDYEPQGASVTMLIAEEPVPPELRGSESERGQSASPGPLPNTVIGHLDKSHITVHTYPEQHPDNGISTFRADIDVSTCGRISPLRALNYLIHRFNPDIACIDYRVRGFTRDIDGNKYFIDHDINSIQDFISKDTINRYNMYDVNVYQENLFCTRMTLRDFDLDDYLFHISADDIRPSKKKIIMDKIKTEMAEIFSGRNLKSFN
ncbi:adenosylmethionine decarboxylase [Dethiosulfovibrio sp. F2B]|uniref:adenosylmethionine decarboxylase n=1 Tax=Dethiosulfovibrio faecalis TaxID=2720018 RepID=UPI001F2548E6|nr:adenosylmethionine decarboxylase [Dethiosulfovibrio faecalis]MCF4150307.1 adenosylmethionine decarboxylase [Dethiosulfovibrio faecalis]